MTPLPDLTERQQNALAAVCALHLAQTRWTESRQGRSMLSPGAIERHLWMREACTLIIGSGKR